MTEDYRSRFYELYRSTHLAHRGKPATRKAFAKRYGKWDRQIGPYLPEDRQAAILDCGCGNGQIVAWLRDRGYELATGVDGSIEEVEVARSLEVPVEHGDFCEALKQHDGDLDFVIMRNVIEHFHKHEIVDMLQSLRTALKPGGKAWIQMPNGESPFGSRLRWADFTHETVFTPVSVRQVLGVCGLATHTIGPIANSHKGWRRWRWRVVEWLYKQLLAAELGGPTDCVVTMDLFAVAVRPTDQPKTTTEPSEN